MSNQTNPSPIHSIDSLKPLITIAEASELGIATARHIRKMCERGEVKAVKVGRVWRINRDALLVQFGLV